MNSVKVIAISNKERNEVYSGYKIVEVNVKNPAESIYAVCTPIKKYE